RHSAPARLEEGMEWKVSSTPAKEIRLELVLKRNGLSLAGLNVSEGLARHLMAVLKDALRTMPANAGATTVISTDTGKLPFNEDFSVPFSAEARAEMRAVYRDRLPDGTTVSDRRPTL